MKPMHLLSVVLWWIQRKPEKNNSKKTKALVYATWTYFNVNAIMVIVLYYQGIQCPIFCYSFDENNEDELDGSKSVQFCAFT